MRKKKFKENWNVVDEVCPHCKQITKVNRGLTKQNLGKLLRKPTSQDWIILIIIFLSIFGTWVYVGQLNTYKELWENPDKFCEEYDYRIRDYFLNNSDDSDASNLIPNIILTENEEIK